MQPEPEAAGTGSYLGRGCGLSPAERRAFLERLKAALEAPETEVLDEWLG